MQEKSGDSTPAGRYRNWGRVNGPLMAEFFARYPSITLQLQEMSQEKIEDMLCRDELDVGIAFAPVHSPELEAIPLLTESLALVVAQHHPLAVHEQVALSRLHDEKLVLLSAEFATREQIDHYCEKAGLHPQVVIEANSISAVLADSPHFPFHIVTSSDCHTT